MADLFVYIIDSHPTEPVYHQLGGRTLDDDGGGALTATCGRVIWSWTANEQQRAYDAHLRHEHATLFARPCTRCFGLFTSARDGLAVPFP